MPLPMKPNRIAPPAAAKPAEAAARDASSAAGRAAPRGDIRRTCQCAHEALKSLRSSAESASEMCTTASARAYTAR